MLFNLSLLTMYLGEIACKIRYNFFFLLLLSVFVSFYRHECFNGRWKGGNISPIFIFLIKSHSILRNCTSVYGGQKNLLASLICLYFIAKDRKTEIASVLGHRLSIVQRVIAWTLESYRYRFKFRQHHFLWLWLLIHS